MRLDFNILWVEDHKEYVESQRVKIERLMKKEGFRLRVLFASSITQAIDFLSDEIYGDHIDLVLMDYDLGIGGRGDDGLVEVRNNFPFKDIVFYSSQANDLPELVANKRVQGVFCSTRNDLPDTVDGVFDALIKKVLDIDHSRGIVMGASSDIDYCVHECLVKNFDKGDDHHKQFAMESIQQAMNRKAKRLEEISSEIVKIEHLSELNKKQFLPIYTSYDKLDLLKKLLEVEKLHQESVEKIGHYMNTTIPKRNKLAHTQVVNGDGFSRKLIGGDGKELNSEQMRLLRQDLLQIQDHFEELSEKLESDENQSS